MICLYLEITHVAQIWAFIFLISQLLLPNSEENFLFSIITQHQIKSRPIFVDGISSYSSVSLVGNIPIRLFTLGRLCTVSGMWICLQNGNSCMISLVSSKWIFGVSFHPKVTVFNLIWPFVFIFYSCQVRYLFMEILNMLSKLFFFSFCQGYNQCTSTAIVLENMV